jgi:hypothetical protein
VLAAIVLIKIIALKYKTVEKKPIYTVPYGHKLADAMARKLTMKCAKNKPQFICCQFHVLGSYSDMTK